MGFYDLTIQTGSNYTKTFTVKDNGSPVNLSGYAAYMYFVSAPGEISSVVFSTVSGQITNGNETGTLTLSISPEEISLIDGDFYKLEIDDGAIQTEILTGNVFILSESRGGIEYLIPILRLQLGDTNPLEYRYMDEWLKVSLLTAIKALQRWWGAKYTVDSDNNITRNTDITFGAEEPNVIQTADERPLILMASILVKSGQLESNSWNVGSWKDAEISLSTIETGRSKEFSIKLDWEELKSYLTPPTKKLFGALRLSLPDAEE